MKVAELSKRYVATIGPRDSVVAAAKRMRDEHVGDLIVVEADRPIGVLTDRDLVVSVVAAELPDWNKLSVGDVIDRSVLVTTSEDEELDALLPRMRSFAVRRVPVVDEHDKLCGVIALDDILTWIRDELAEATAIPRRQRQEEARRRMRGDSSSRSS